MFKIGVNTASPLLEGKIDLSDANYSCNEWGVILYYLKTGHFAELLFDHLLATATPDQQNRIASVFAEYLQLDNQYLEERRLSDIVEAAKIPVIKSYDRNSLQDYRPGPDDSEGASAP